ncbi:hypothetical protein ACFL1L_00915 [Thermoplasmatota archaeon]
MKKIIGIFIVTLLIVTVLPATGSIEKNSYLTEKNELLVFLDPINSKEIQYIMVDANTESDIDKSMVQSLDNLVPNPSFEEGDTLPTGWAYTDTIGYDVTHIWDSSDAHSGDKSIGISMASYKSWGPFEEWYTTDYIPADLSNNTYELSVWVKFLKEPPKDQHAWVAIKLYDANKNILLGGVSFGFMLHYTSDWKYARMDTNWLSNFDSTDDIRYVTIVLGQIYSNNDKKPDDSVIVRFDDVFFGYLGSNTPPDKPAKPTGPAKGTAGIYYNYSTSATDLDNDFICYNFSWGDGTYNEIYYNYPGELVTISHNWSVDGTYSLRVKVRDSIGARTWSDWSDPLEVSMPKSYNQIPKILLWLFERFPFLQPYFSHFI